MLWLLGVEPLAVGAPLRATLAPHENGAAFRELSFSAEATRALMRSAEEVNDIAERTHAGTVHLRGASS